MHPCAERPQPTAHCLLRASSMLMQAGRRHRRAQAQPCTDPLRCAPCPPPPRRLDDPVGGEHMNIMKAGIITAHR